MRKDCVGVAVGGIVSGSLLDAASLLDTAVLSGSMEGILDGDVSETFLELFSAGELSSKRADVGVDGGDLGISIGSGTIGIGVGGVCVATGACVRTFPSTSNSTDSVKPKSPPEANEI